MKVKKNKGSKKWIFKIVLFTFLISAFVNFGSIVSISNINIYFAFLILLVIILIGVIFDMIGVAVTLADKKKFNSMASKKRKGAKTALRLIKNSDKVSNFCNDVIGDVCGVISGAVGLIIINSIQVSSEKEKLILSILISSLIASFTVGGKALGKNLAINNADYIIYSVVTKIIKKKDKGKN